MSTHSGSGITMQKRHRHPGESRDPFALFFILPGDCNWIPGQARDDALLREDDVLPREGESAWRATPNQLRCFYAGDD